MAKSSSDSKSTAKSLRQQVRDYISQQGHGTFNYKQVAAALGVNSQSQLRSIAMTLAEMDFDGDLLQVAPGKYKLPQWVNRDQVHLFQFADRNSDTEHDRSTGRFGRLFSP